MNRKSFTTNTNIFKGQNFVALIDGSFKSQEKSKHFCEKSNVDAF